VTKASKLVERDGAQILTGVIGGGESYAADDFSRQNKVPLVISGDAGQDELTLPGPLENPYMVRVTMGGRTATAAAADWAYKKGWRELAMIGADYAGGVDTNFEFARAFCRLGGKALPLEIVRVIFGKGRRSRLRTASASGWAAPRIPRAAPARR
jgi:branched-chain amino acid transport system substrate-binding protein